MKPIRLLALLSVVAMSACAPVSPYGPTLGTPVAGAAPVGAPYGTYCAAGAYQCQLAQSGPVGAPCACPGLGAPSYGVIR